LAQGVLLHRDTTRQVEAGGTHGLIGPRSKLDVGPLGNGGGQHENTVVIGVLADQVHSAWGIGGDLRWPAEQGLKVSHDGGGRLLDEAAKLSKAGCAGVRFPWEWAAGAEDRAGGCDLA